MGKSLDVLIFSFTDFPNPTWFPAAKKKKYTVSGFSPVTSIRLPETQRQDSEASDKISIIFCETFLLKYLELQFLNLIQANNKWAHFHHVNEDHAWMKLYLIID